MNAEKLKKVNMYIDGELEGSELAEFERQLRSDPELRTVLDDFRSLDRQIRAMEVYRAPDIKYTRTVWTLRRQLTGRAGAFLGGALAAAACILLVLGTVAGPERPPGSSKETLRMIYYAPEAGSVSVLGDFNGWSGEIPLKPKGKQGYWLAEIPVQPGEYKYVLLVDGVKTAGDPLADYVIDDDFGSKNSVLRVGL